MISDLIEDSLKALRQLGDGRTLVLLMVSAAEALIVLLTSIGLVGWSLSGLALSGFWWLDAAIQWFGTAAASVLGWFLYPLVATAILGLFSDQICGLVERHYYPELPPAKGLGLAESIAEALSFLGFAILLNVLVLPLYLLPGPNILIYLGLNGWLLGREYFDSVGFRRHSRSVQKQMRRDLRFEIWLAGILIAGILLLPVLNLIAPVLGLALMVHQHKRYSEPPIFNY